MDRFDYNTIGTMAIDDGMSYSPNLIMCWAQKQIKELDYESEIRDAISEMLFNYFVNNSTGLHPANKYFIRERKGTIILVRDRGLDDNKRLKDYIITTTKDGNSKATKRRMTGEEMKLLDEVLREHEIPHSIKEYESLFRK